MRFCYREWTWTGAIVLEATERDTAGSENAENSYSGRSSNSLELVGAFVGMDQAHGLATCGKALTLMLNVRGRKSSFLAIVAAVVQVTWRHAGLANLGMEEERRGHRTAVVVVPMASRLDHSS